MAASMVTLHILLFLPVVFAVIDLKTGCEYGWFNINRYCVKIATKSSWHQAFQSCHSQQATLMTSLELEQHYEFLSQQGIIEGWTGEFVRAGRLTQDDVARPQFNDGGEFPEGPLNPGSQFKTLYNIGSSFNNRYNYSITRDTGCGRFNIPQSTGINNPTTTTSATPPFTPPEEPVIDGPIDGPTTGTIVDAPVGSPVPVFNWNLADCDIELPVICSKLPDSIQSVLKPVSQCPKGWLGDLNLLECYLISQETKNYFEAVDACSVYDGILLKINTESHLSLLNGTSGMPSSVWIASEEDQCNVFIKSYGNQVLSWDCLQQVHYICTIPVQFPESNPVVSVPRQLTSRSYFSGEIEVSVSPRQLGFELETEIPTRFICSVPEVFTGLHKLQWVKDGVYLPSFTPGGNSGNVDSLSISGILREILGQEVSNGRVRTEDILGYYWCEILDLKSNTIRRSQKIYLNLQATRTYAASIQLNNGYITNTDGYYYNLMKRQNIPGVPTRKRRSIQSLNNVILSVQNPLPNIVESGFNYPTTKVNRFRSNGGIVDLQVFQSVTEAESGFSETERLKTSRDSFLRSYDISQISDGTILKFVSTDFCLSKNISFVMNDITYQHVVSDTRLGDEWQSPTICLLDQQPMGRMVCDGDKIYGASWGELELNPNCDVRGLGSSSVTPVLEDLVKNLNETNAGTIVKEVKDVTSDTGILTPVDIVYIESIITSVSNTSNITEQILIDVVTIIDNILKTPEDTIKIADTKHNVTENLLTSLETIELKVDLGETGVRQAISPQVISQVWRIKTNPVIGLSVNGEENQRVTSFVVDDVSNLYKYQELIYKTTDVAIILDGPFVRDFIMKLNASEVRLAMHIFNDSKLFPMDSTRYQLNSKIISATLAVEGSPVKDLNGSYVTSVFYPIQTLETDVRSKYGICVYWDVTQRNWSTNGCEYKNTTSGRDVCVCNHLTNFAVLLDLYGQDNLVSPEHLQALSIISIIGLTLSIVGLSLTVLSFIFFKKLRKGRAQQTLFNLALAMLASWIVFLAGINETGDHNGCIAVAALLHYFILASFMWMLMEGILQYLLFVKVLGTYYDRYMLKTAIPAWVLPIVPVAILLAIDVELYNGGESYCWMSLPAFYYGFAIPVCLIILANIIIYIMVTVSICKRKSIHTDSTKSKSQATVNNVRASFCCFIILGVSWVFGFLAISDARLVFQYIFTIVNSLQGFLVFVLFTARDKNVRDYWKQLLCGCCSKHSNKGSSKSKTSDATPKNSSDLAFTDVRKNSTPSLNDVNGNGGVRIDDPRMQSFSRQSQR